MHIVLDRWADFDLGLRDRNRWNRPVVQKRTHVFLPSGLLADIDTLVGKGNRSAFLTELAEREVRRQKLLRAPDEAAGCWEDNDHPELKEGSAAFVNELRQGSDTRLPKDG